MNSKLRPDQTANLAPHIEHELFLASRPINRWRLGPQGLQAAVGTFAPAPGLPVLVHDTRP